MDGNFMTGAPDGFGYDLNSAQTAMDEFYETLDEASKHASAAALSDCDVYGSSDHVPLLSLGPEIEVQEVPPPGKGKKKNNDKQKEKKNAGGCHRGLHFKEEEDLIIVSGWLNVATDAAVGTSQKQDSFAKRLWQYYMEAMQYQSPRSQNSIQQRWQLIKTSVSEFHAIFCALERRRESGKTEKDLIADAVRMYEQHKPWQFRHCWEVLRFEPRWDAKFQEIQAGKKGKQQSSEQPSDPRTETASPGTNPTQRPDGRDTVKRRRTRQPSEDASSTGAVEMLQRMHDRDQEMDAKDNVHKEELMNLERAKVSLQQKLFDHQVAVEEKKMALKERELDENRRLKEMAMETRRFQTDMQIMFTDPATMHPSIRQWIVKKQKDIMMKDGLEVDNSDSQSYGN